MSLLWVDCKVQNVTFIYFYFTIYIILCHYTKGVEIGNISAKSVGKRVGRKKNTPMVISYTLHKSGVNQCGALYIINSAGIAYHQNFSFVYHQADSFFDTHLRCDEIQPQRG